MAEKPIGKRFSHLYLKDDNIYPDRKRARVRISKYFSNNIGGLPIGIVSYLEEELGVEVPSSPFGPIWNQFFLNIETRDFLDSLTLIYERILMYKSPTGTGLTNPYSRRAEQWRSFLERVFSEEQLSYSIDGQCGVHFLYDEEFERNTTATTGFLSSPRFTAVSKGYEEALDALREKTPDTRKAVLSLFDAAESLFKNLFENKKISRLTATELKKQFIPLLEPNYEGHPRAINASKQALESFCKWVDAVQQYRHGQKDKSHSPPPLELAVLLVSQGASFLRWMIEIKEKEPSK